MKNLDVNILAGAPFMAFNDIAVRPATHILGYLNCDMLNDDPDPPTIILKGILESYQLFQLITEP